MRPVSIALPEGGAVSGLWQAPETPVATLALAHGAGSSMTHRAMTAIADGLCARGIATLRYNFPYVERGSKRPDTPATAHVAVRAAVAQARRLAPAAPLFAGGRSFGGRMTSQAEALAPMGLRGLVFFAFPLHPAAGNPGVARAAHLKDVAVPMLFLQGTRDTLSNLDLLKPVVRALAPRGDLVVAEGADHSFHTRAKSGRKDAEVLAEILDAACAWMRRRGTPA